MEGIAFAIHLGMMTTGSHHRGSLALPRVDPESAPWLADHRVEDLVVLPGAFYVEAARRHDQESLGARGVVMRDMRFHRPVVLSNGAASLSASEIDDGDGVLYRFHESVDTDTPTAEVVVEWEGPPTGEGLEPVLELGAFRRAATRVEGDLFYDQLALHGNSYGPSFRRVRTAWRLDDRVLGEIDVPQPGGSGGMIEMHPSVIDAMAHLLASGMMTGSAFVLRSIDRVRIFDPRLPQLLWAHATWEQAPAAEGSEAVGRVRATDDSGRVFIELEGLRFSRLESLRDTNDSAGVSEAVGPTDPADATEFVVAANFTAEPVEDSLRFWGAEFGAPVRVTFAPHDQVFQQLLDPAGALRSNRDGVSVVLLSLEEWRDRRPVPALALRPREGVLPERDRLTLPNGLEITHLNAYETEYLFKEIFEDRVYLRHGIELRDGATVLDVGANIGMFSLFVLANCKDPVVYAFEPAPAAHERLAANLAAYGSSAHAINAGVGATETTAPFTFYERSTVFSGFHADEDDDREAVEAVVRNALAATTLGDAEVERHLPGLTADRLRATIHDCRLTTISDTIRERGIERIDLLKVDAEKSEWEVLQGIADTDWPRISQVVMEIHDRSGSLLPRVEALLSGRGFQCVAENESALSGSGLCTLYATRGGRRHAERKRAVALEGLDRNVEEFCTAVRAVAAEPGSAPLIVCVCPRTPVVDVDPQRGSTLDDAEDLLLLNLEGVAGVHTISSASLRERYALRDIHDPEANAVGHIPYSSECYAAIGTAVFRAAAAQRTDRYKVIALDCDNTLWAGVCAEDGALGVAITGAHRRLQEFVARCARDGMLLCLCSKNTEADVMAVFDERRDMVLGRSHFAAWRINWGPKSESLASLARELDLGLDSFVFLDDSPVEIAEVRANCPGVLAIQLPAEPSMMPRFLEHLWALDGTALTNEDRSRTRMYQEGARRDAYRADAPSLESFVRGLQLRVRITPIEAGHLGRAAQLTHRTNQFNLSGVKRRESELSEFLQRPGAAGRVVHVEDRFGDYGLVGLVLYERSDESYRVDTLLLSCRVLGRGVEHRVLAELGRAAAAEGVDWIELPFRASGRNAPARLFLQHLDPAGDDSTTSWLFRTPELARLVYEPSDAAPVERDAPPASTQPAPREAPPRPESRSSRRHFGDRDVAALLPRIAERLSDAGRIAAAIDTWRSRDREDTAPTAPQGIAPRGAMEEALLSIWRRVLGRPRIGAHENFFEAGGSSLRAIQVLAQVRRELGHEVSIVTLFECPTVSRLAAALRRAADGTDDGAAEGPHSKPASRGAGRRSTRRRRAS